MLENNKTELLKTYVVRGDDVSVTITHPVFEALLRILGYDISGNINAIIITKKTLL